MAEQGKTMQWLRWYIEDVVNLREVFNDEQMGTLFFAVMKTAENGERQEVSPDIKFAYLQLCNLVDKSRTKYFKTCETNAKNGAKGGKAKAAKAKKEAETESETAETESNEAKVKSPTITSFRNVAKHICKTYDFEHDAYEIDSLFDRFAKNNWCIMGKSILADNYLYEAAIFAELADYGQYRTIFYAAMKMGKEVDIEELDFIDSCYDKTRKVYEDPVRNKTHSTVEEALAAYGTFDDEDELDEN